MVSRFKFQNILSIIVAMLLVTGFNNIEAKPKQKAFPIGNALKLKSRILDQERPILVHTPRYYQNTDKEYPVLYVLDAENHFEYVCGLTTYLADLGRIPPMIVIGLVNIDRAHDYTLRPYPDNPTGGGADLFLQFLEHELIPHIDNTYRTVSYRIIFGHSLCGMYSLYSMIKQPALFQACFAFSPWLSYENQFIVRLLEQQIHTQLENKPYIYINTGDEPDGIEILEKLKRLFAQNSQELPYQWKIEFLRSEDHTSVVPASAHRALLSLFRMWSSPGGIETMNLKKMKNHYLMLSQRFGFHMDPPEHVLRKVGQNILAKNNVQEALELFEISVHRFPDSPFGHEGLGMAYESNNQFLEAELNYKKAIKIGKKKNTYRLPYLYENLYRIQVKKNTISGFK